MSNSLKPRITVVIGCRGWRRENEHVLIKQNLSSRGGCSKDRAQQSGGVYGKELDGGVLHTMYVHSKDPYVRVLTLCQLHNLKRVELMAGNL